MRFNRLDRANTRRTAVGRNHEAVGMKPYQPLRWVHSGQGSISTPPTRPAAAPTDESMLANHGRTFHFATRFMPAHLRPQIASLYAFFRTLDDLVDMPALDRPSAAIRAELAAWRTWLDGDATHPAPRAPLGARVAVVLDAHRVPKALLYEFLDGMDSDLQPRQVQDFRELRDYCYRVAGTVGRAMAHVMGATSPPALVAAEHLGIAMQLTNMLRDVGGDLAAERIYLPADELARFGSSSAHLEQLVARGRGPDERFRALMREQIARARRYYALGMAGIWLLPRDCRFPILVAARLYRAILASIERADYDVLRRRVATSVPEKVGEAIVAFTLDRLWRRGDGLPSGSEEVLLGC